MGKREGKMEGREERRREEREEVGWYVLAGRLMKG